MTKKELHDKLTITEQNVDTLLRGYNQQVEIIRDINTKLLQALVIIDDLLGTNPSPETARVFLQAFRNGASE